MASHNRPRGTSLETFLLLLLMAALFGAKVADLRERILALEQSTAGCQQGVSGTPAPGVAPPGAAVTSFPVNDLRGHGPLAQPVEQRTFNPLSACTQYQAEAKLRGNPADFDARSAPGCAGLHVDRASGGRQEGP